MGYRFSLVLSREITEDEMTTLQFVFTPPVAK